MEVKQLEKGDSAAVEKDQVAVTETLPDRTQFDGVRAQKLPRATS
jgi:hypothetical protein